MLCLLIPGKTVFSLIFLSWFLIVEEKKCRFHLYISFEFCYYVYGMVWYGTKIDLIDVSS